MAGMEDFIGKEIEFVSKATDAVKSSTFLGPNPDEKNVCRELRHMVLSAPLNDELDTVDVSEYAEKLTTVTNALHYLGWMGVNRYISSEAGISTEARWATPSRVHYSNSENYRAQKSTALLEVFRPVKKAHAVFSLESKSGQKLGALLAYFEQTVGGFILKVTGDEFGDTASEVIETLDTMANGITEVEELRFKRQRLISKFMCDLLLGPEVAGREELPGQITPKYIPITGGRDERSSGCKLAQALWSEEMKTFWKEGVTQIDIEDAEAEIENFGDKVKLPSEVELQSQPLKEKILVNGSYLSILRDTVRSNPEENRVFIGITNYLLQKSEDELSACIANLQRFV